MEWGFLNPHKKLWFFFLTFFFLTLFNYLIHGLMYVAPRVRGLLYFTVTSSSTLEIECPTPCIPVLCQQCIQAFNFKPFLLHSNHAFLGRLRKPNRLIISSDVILSISFLEQIHLVIVISLRLRRETSSCVAAYLNSPEIFFLFQLHC